MNLSADASINLEDVYAAVQDTADPTTFHVHALLAVDRKTRRDATYTFTSTSQHDADTWVDTLQHVLAGVAPGGASTQRIN